MTIKFGTSGWRAIIAEEFTFPNVRLVTQAIVEHLKKSHRSGKGSVLVGYDNRFFSAEFALEASAIILKNGFTPLLSKESIATPILSLECLRRKAIGIINFTASHNPYQYNGLKFSPQSAGPALPEDTQSIEAEIQRLQRENYPCDKPAMELHDPALKGVDLATPYYKKLDQLINFKAIKKAQIPVIYSPLHGAGIGVMGKFLGRHDIPITCVDEERDPYFGHHHPEPDADNLAHLAKRVKAGEFKLGLGTDGDADRFGIIDSAGIFISPNHFLPLLADYLIETRKFKGGLARSLATSHLLDLVATHHKRELHETPVGFKFIGELISQGKLVLGGEESAGLTIGGHIPEKDGILACLLALEMVAVRGTSLTEQLKTFWTKFGKLFSQRINYQVQDKEKEQLLEKLKNPEKHLGTRKTIAIDRRDGVKFKFGANDWVLARLSGTEPLVRLYAESETQKGLLNNIAWGQELIYGKRRGTPK